MANFSIISISFIILTLNYGTLLAHVTVSVQSDLILPQFCNSICFRDGLQSSSALWTRWL